MNKIQCPHCENRAVKNGFHRIEQRYKCTSCGKRFQLEYTYRAYRSKTNQLLISLLKEGCGVRSISRIMGISTKTVLSRLLKVGKSIKTPYFTKLGCKFEVDELFVKISNGKSRNWIAYGIERETRKVINFVITSSRSKEAIKPIIDKILLVRPTKIYTDKLNIYPSLIPVAIHRRFQYCTNQIERKNLTLRTHIKRLARRTICFSKKQQYLDAHLRIYFWG